MLIISVLFSFRPSVSVTVKGSVRDVKSNPLAGVAVSENGTGNKTFTDKNGAFTIILHSEKSMLLFEAAGFDAAKSTVPASRYLVVTLQASRIDNLSGQLLDRSVPGAAITPSPKSLVLGSGSERAILSRGQLVDKMKYYKPGIPDAYRKREEFNTEDYDAIVENRFVAATENPLSTFSIDVDAASYSNVRRYLQAKQLPPAGSVRIEEMINYFHYEYPQPLQEEPFSINTEIAACPWNTRHQLVLIGLQGKKIEMEKLPASNIVFLIDVSGSMMSAERLPLVKTSMKLLVDQLRDQDKVSIVVYAGNAGLVLPSTSGSDKMTIKDAVDRLEAGGSTAGGEGIKLAYKTAVSNFIIKGNNRVILCTDGDFNVGASSDAELESMIEKERKSGVYLTVLGYGMGNYKDNKMQKLADKGNGNHAYIDGINEAKKVLVNEFGGTLFTIAKDVKLQVEFNPGKVQSYRLIGYENRLLNKEDFNNDAKDAGELGSGHTVTALYEVIPVGEKNEFVATVDPLKYQEPSKHSNYVTTSDGEIMNIKFRYKEPDGTSSKLITHPVKESRIIATGASANFRFAAAVAEFGMLLCNSEYKQSSTYESVDQLAKNALGKDKEGYRSEFLQLVRKAGSLKND
jgi:Ca-activated chloride channel family protein